MASLVATLRLAEGSHAAKHGRRAPHHQDLEAQLQARRRCQHQGGRFYPPGQDITISRRGIPLAEGYVVTDFYTQGMSFKENCWVAHLNLPPGGGTTNATLRASMFVLLSRFASWEHVRILVPLWRSNATQKEKDKIIDRYHNICKLPENFKAELERLKKQSAATLMTLGPFLGGAATASPA